MNANATNELIPFLKEAAEWSTFAASLYDQTRRGKHLSERQLACARDMKAKIDARKAAELASNHEDPQVIEDDLPPVLNLGPIRAMFEAAVDNGYKSPIYRAEGLVLSRASDAGRNPGAIYVRNTDGVYGGKVVGTTFTPSRDAQDERFASVYSDPQQSEVFHMTALDALTIIAADPKAAAVRFGRQTGKCSCCGRTLTDPESIRLGIGPICLKKWGR
jgi:hypothetical protein